jgi:hypothetical protein
MIDESMETPAMVPTVLRLLRPAGALAALLTACALSGACSNNSSTPPSVYIIATLGVGSSSPAPLCNFASSQPWVSVGTNTNSSATPPSTVQDGNNAASGGKVSVNCTVAPSGNGFDVRLSVTEAGLSGGTVTITSPSGQGAVTASAGASGLTGVFSSSTYGTYTSNDCTIAFTYNGESITGQPPIAAGRIWGHLSCPVAINSNHTTTGLDGGTANEQCDAEGDFLFEECGQ